MAKSDTNTEIALINQDLGYKEKRIATIEQRLIDFVTKDDFALVRGIVFGLVGMIVIAVIGALISRVVIK
jgi:hypothetical protein